MEKNQEIFIEKLDRFIRKYYQNQLLRGVLLSIVCIAIYFLVLSFSEYFLYLSVFIRTGIVIFSVLLLCFLVVKLLIIPLIGLLRIGNRISYRQAVDIIEKHFPDLEDRLLNTLELTELSGKPEFKANSLVLASINQRIESIRLVPFRKAVSFRENVVYLKYLAGIIFIFTVLYFFVPDIYSESTTRLVHFRQHYTAPAAFCFELDTDSLKAVKGSDFELKVHTKGKYSPEEAYIVYGNSRFLMKKNDVGKFSYLFRNVNTSIHFHFEAGKVTSKNSELKLIMKPGLRNILLEVEAPAYTNIPDRKEENISNLSVPEGSVVKWNIQGEDADDIRLNLADRFLPVQKRNDKNRFVFSEKIFQKSNYKIYASNQEFKNEVFAHYSIDVIPDNYPQIQINSVQDSVLNSGYYFKGIVKDDYGFSKLRFVYQEEKNLPVYISIPIQKNRKTQEFYFAFDFAAEQLSEGSLVEYFFEVFDNDEINQPKMTRSVKYNYYLPDSKQIYELNKAVQDSISNQFEKSIQLTKSIQDDIARLQKNMLDGSADKWQQQQMIQEIGSKKRELDELLKGIQKENLQKNQLMNASGMQDPQLLKKQKQIEELLEKVMDEELKNLFDEFNKLAEEFKSEELNKLGNQLKMSVSDFQKQMDRNLQLLERYEIEIRVKQLVTRIENMADEHDKAASENRKNKEQLLMQQDSDLEKWQNLEKDVSDVLEQNSTIQQPYQFQDLSSDEKEISDLLENTRNLLQQGKPGKAIKNMKQTAQKQREMSQKLSDNIASSATAQLKVDVDNLIRLMSNLIEFSFRQEALLEDFRKINYQNPLFVKKIEEQGILKEEYQLVQDSLLALSARSPQVASLIGNRIFEVENDLEKVLEESSRRRKIQAISLQQKVITEVNELSLFLSEALKSLMEQMANSMPGDQISDKMGNKNSLSGMKSEQESLKKMLEELIQEIKNGQGNSGTKEKLGKFLQKQEMFRDNLGKMIRKTEMNHETEKILREVMKMLDKTESEVANFSINSTTVFRHNKIISRLLEAENTQREKDFDNKRKSNSGNNLKLSNPREIFEYKRVRTDFDDVFYNSNLKMFDYYNKLYLDYMIRLNND